jgi:hypothetical protein
MVCLLVHLFRIEEEEECALEDGGDEAHAKLLWFSLYKSYEQRGASQMEVTATKLL